MRPALQIALSAVLLLLCGGLAGARSLFPPTLEASIPSQFRDFVDRYVGEMISEHVPDGTAERRMKFDEVDISFPLTAEATELLPRATGVCFMMEMGRRYSIVWMQDSLEMGRISFPASFNLIRGTSQKESFNRLANVFAARHAAPLSANVRPTSQPDSLNIIRREGHEFYLGHLANHRWIDATGAHPVWSPEFPAESVANLFCIEGMPDARVAMEMIDYRLERRAFDTSLSALREILGDKDRCEVFFGVSIMRDDAPMEAVVVFHNPELAYIHKLELEIDLPALFNAGASERSAPAIRAILHPYIKLHNLSDLWGEKNSNANIK